MRHYFSFLFVLSLFFLSTSNAYSLRPGDVRVFSYTGQPLNLQMPLYPADGEDTSNISVLLASPEIHKKYGLDYPYNLEALSFSVKENTKGNLYVDIIGSTIQTASLLHFVLIIDNGVSSQYKNIIKVLNEPRMVAKHNSRPHSMPGDEKLTSSAKHPYTSGKKDTRKQGINTPSNSEYGPIVTGEMLWSIAGKVSSDNNVSIEQVILAFADINPDAFIGNNPNQLKVGAMLTIPSLDEINTRSKHEAISGLYAIGFELPATFLLKKTTHNKDSDKSYVGNNTTLIRSINREAESKQVSYKSNPNESNSDVSGTKEFDAPTLNRKTDTDYLSFNFFSELAYSNFIYIAIIAVFLPVLFHLKDWNTNLDIKTTPESYSDNTSIKHTDISINHNGSTAPIPPPYTPAATLNSKITSNDSRIPILFDIVTDSPNQGLFSVYESENITGRTSLTKETDCFASNTALMDIILSMQEDNLNCVVSTLDDSSLEDYIISESLLPDNMKDDHPHNEVTEITNPSSFSIKDLDEDLFVTKKESDYSKLELSEAYIELGDVDGATILLKEIINDDKNHPDTDKAKTLLVKMG